MAEVRKAQGADTGCSLPSVRSTSSFPPSRSYQWSAFQWSLRRSTLPQDIQRTGVDISPAHWGISKADLDFFRGEVMKLWAEGSIADNPEFPNPFHSDKEVGPTIYQVNEQYIKPTTLRAGGMSWALMRHPNGLKCDVFASHAWGEGCFEFIWKVSMNWPRNACGLYCCFLANPQNGDIGTLLGNDPAHSPFARALEACSHVIIVPNRRVSVYSRLWCVFEAHLAMEHHLQIVMPTRPKAKHVIFRMLPYLIPSSLFCLLFCYLESQLLFQPHRPWTACNLQRLLVLLFLPWAFRARRLYVSCFCFAVSWQLAHWITHDGKCIEMLASPKTRALGMQVLADNIDSIFITLTSVECVFTELVAEALESEGRQLDSDTVQNASCSNHGDRDAIRQIISGREHGIDSMVTMLKQVGRYNDTVEQNLKCGMNPVRVKDGVMHMRGVGGSCLWMEVLIRFIAAAANRPPAVVTLECGMLARIICCAATFCLTVWWGEGATYFADTLLWTSLVAHFLNEFLWYAIYRQRVSTVFLDNTNPLEALGYALVLIGVGVVAVSLIIRFYRQPLKQCIPEPPNKEEQSSSEDTEDAVDSTRESV